MAGDSAHPHGGAFASGGSLALDDAYALYLAFNHAFAESRQTSSDKRIDQALRLYDQTRRPHTARLQNIVMKGINKPPTATGSVEDDELVVARAIKNKPNTTWLSEHDVDRAFDDVVGGRGKGGSRI